LVFTHAPLDDSPLAVEEASLLYTDIVIRGVESRAATFGYSLLLRSMGASRSESMTSLMDLSATVDGLIVLDRILSGAEERTRQALATRVARRTRRLNVGDDGARR
jgi:DNA-binding LacI/PurR family transcriptional regulator